MRENGMVNDRLTVGGDPVHLSDVRVPFLTVRADRDHIVPPDATAPLIDLVGSPDKHELCLDAGHMGLVVGRTAARTTVPTILDFLRRRSDEVGRRRRRGRPEMRWSSSVRSTATRSLRFFAALPEGDLHLHRGGGHRPRDGALVGVGWAPVGPLGRGGRRREVTGYVAVRPLPGWSDHVGEVRLVVAPARRAPGWAGSSPGTPWCRPWGPGLTKLVVEVVAEQGAALALFTDLGFTGEALLVDHIRDRNGDCATSWCWPTTYGDTWAGMDAVGVADELSSR